MSTRKFIFDQLKPFHRQLSILLVIALIWAADLSLRPYLIKMIIDRMTVTLPQNVWHEVAWLVALYIGASLFVSTMFRIWNIIRRNFIPYLRINITRHMTNHLLHQSYQYYQNNFAGSLANKINDVSYGVSEVVEITLNDFIGNFLAIIIAAIVLFTVNPVVAAIFSVWSILFLLGSRYFARNAHKLSDKTSELRSQQTGKIVDVFGNMSIARLFSRQTFEKKNIKQWTHATMEAERAFDWELIKLFAFQSLSFVVMQGLVLFYLVYARSKSEITVGDFALVFTINVYIVDNLWNLGRQFLSFSEQFGKVTQGLRITMQEHNLTDSPDAKAMLVPQGKIEFRDVEFQYNHKNTLFNHFNLTILPGQKIGLVGYSGSGKTTLVNLILRLFDISAGGIYIDEQNIKAVTQQSLREKISLIPQDPTLFHRTLFENIAYGQISATAEEVMAAARMAHAHEFIERLPDQYNTMVGERGIKLSGGQRQRIAIARAILKNALILILDEATSALDSFTEQLIQDSLIHLMRGKTTLIVAHRLSTLLHTDRILVFDNGVIVEDGTHSELLTRNGVYAKLWYSQVNGFLPNHE